MIRNPPPDAIGAVERSELLPASLAQQRLWFLSQLHGADRAYHIHSGLRLEGRLNREALTGALDAIVQRHEVLRTTFRQVDGAAWQVIHESSRMWIREHDLSRGEDAAQVLRQIVARESEEGFDLERGPLIRCRLIRMAEEEHVLLVTMHHIVSDAWSMGVMLTELSAVYGALVQGQANPLAPLRMQYADHARWQRSHLDGEGLEQHLQYWRESLQGAPTLIELPADRPRPPVQSYAGASVEVALDEQLTAALKALSRRHGVTLFVTLLASWGAMLTRLANQGSVVVGTPSANRTRKDLEDMIGFFVNMLALRIDVAADCTITGLLARTRDCVLRAQQHAEVPFEHVVEALKPVRSLAHSPLFQVIFVWQNTPRGRADFPGMALSRLDVPSDAAQFDLSLSLGESNGRIAGSLSYATALFERDTVERFVTYWRGLLQGIASGASTLPVAQIPMLTASELHRILHTFNATRVDFARARGRCIAEVFEEQVRLRGDSIAVVSGVERISYGELNRRANRLAHYLREQGVGAEDRVALSMERGVWLVVSLLASLKVQAAYVPLDASYPQARLQYMLEDSAPTMLLYTRGASLGGVERPGLRKLCVEDQGRWEHCADENPVRRAGEDRDRTLAYLIYTSGSSGAPKGVMNEHRAVLNRLLWMQEEYGLEAAEAVLQKTPYSFDVSVWEFYWPLLVGAKLVLAKPEGHKDPGYLRELIETEQVSTLHFVPSMLEAFLELPWQGGECGSVSRVFCSGEALGLSQVQRLGQRLPAAKLYNLYGPTEAAVDVTAHACQPTEGSVPIGRPIANTQIYILDEGGEAVPIGVAGEIYIGGVAVARGYWQRGALTAQRFVPAGWGPGAGRWYRTGDVGRWNGAGEVEYLGRNDEQVKIRGYRIELGEIEERLRTHADVKEAVVVAQREGGSSGGSQQLVAYVTAAGAKSPSVQELRAYIRVTLPQYMLPAAFVLLEKMPLNASGKVDRRALPQPQADSYARRQYEAPQGAVEEALARIWENLLNIPRIGRHDNFFELGGHSLLGMKMIEQARCHAIRISVTTLFERPTIASMTAASSSPVSRELPACVVPIRDGTDRECLFFVHDVSGDAFAYFSIAERLVTHRPIYGLQAFVLESRQQSSVAAMAGHYVQAVRQVQPQGPYRIAGWSVGGLIAQEMARQLEAANQSVAFVGLIDAYPAGEHSHGYEPDDHALWMLQPGATRSQPIDGEVVAMRRRLFEAGRGHVTRPIVAQIHCFLATASLAPARDQRGSARFGSDVRVTEIAGDHWSIMEPPAVVTLAHDLDAAMNLEVRDGSPHENRTGRG